MYTAVDCMGFAGGFTLGMAQSGFQLIGKKELPGGFGVANCEANRHLLGDGWHTQVGPGEEWEPTGATVVFGNPPCSGFSVMTAKASRGIDAKINACMWHFSDFVARERPYISVMESVRQAHKLGYELMLKLRANVEAKTGLQYELIHIYQDALDLGGAARRPRYFMVLSRVPFGIEWPHVRRPTLWDVIGDLEGLAPTWEAQPYNRPASWWAAPARSASGAVDGHVGIRSPYTERCLELLAHVESNGGWPERWWAGKVLKKYYEEHGEVPPGWKPQLERILTKKFELGFTQMSRWPAGEPARVITGAALGAVLHPYLPRTITHREAARIMGFPDDWLIRPLRGRSGLNMTWGKGITVQCGRWIGEWVRRSLDGEPGSVQGDLVGERERHITLVRTPVKV